MESALINENQTAHFGVVYQVIFVLSLIVYAKRNYYISNNLELILNVFFLGQIMYNVLSANITLQRITYYPYVSMVFVIPLLAKSLHSYWTTRNALLLYLIYFVSSWLLYLPKEARMYHIKVFYKYLQNIK